MWKKEAVYYSILVKTHILVKDPIAIKLPSTYLMLFLVILVNFGSVIV